MAFNLFKRKNYADAIIRGGKIYTLDPEYPQAEALAVKEGRVLLAGDAEEISVYEGPNTRIIDLDGAYAVPGFIDRFGAPARAALKGSYLELDGEMDEEAVINQVKAYFDARPAAEFCLAVGIDEELTKGPDRHEDNNDWPTFREKLSEAFPEKAVVLVASNGLNMQVNDAAMELTRARAEEMNVQTVTPSFVIDSVVSTDYDLCVKQLCQIAEYYAKQGVTAVYASEQYNFFEKMYRDLLMDAFQAGLIKQRYYGSFQVRRCLPPQSVLFTAERRRTVCQELGGKINFTTVEMRFSSDKDAPDYMGEDYIKAVTESVADKGYDVRFIALDKDAALTALDIAGNLSASHRKQAFAVVHKEEFTEEELGSVYTGDAAELAVGGFRAKGELLGEELVRDLTETASRDIGAFGLGTLEEGKWADLAIFKEDPFAEGAKAQEAIGTIIAGEQVYEKGTDSAASWAEEMSKAIGINAAELFGEESEEQ